MAKAKAPFRVVTTPEFTAFGVNLAKARAYQPGSPAKFSISAPLSPAEAKPITDAIKDLIAEAFPGRVNAKMQIALENGDLKTLGLPLQQGDQINAKRSADGKNPYDSVAGKLVFRASTGENMPAPICDMAGKPLTGDKVAAGDICRMQVKLVALETPVFTGIVAYLNAVLLVREGARREAADVFKSYLGGSSDVNPFATDDEIPF